MHDRRPGRPPGSAAGDPYVPEVRQVLEQPDMGDRAQPQNAPVCVVSSYHVLLPQWFHYGKTQSLYGISSVLGSVLGQRSLFYTDLHTPIRP